MLARVSFALPFDIWISSEDEYHPQVNQIGNHRVVIHPLEKTSLPPLPTSFDELSIDGHPAIRANVLKVDIKKKSFYRKIDGNLDPPKEYIEQIVNSFIIRLRYLLRAPHIEPIEIGKSNWHLNYLNDDGTELAERKGYRRAFVSGTQQYKMSFAIATPQAWAQMQELGPSYELPLWAKLLLDGRNLVPNISPIIVLSFAALEVFSAITLEKLRNHHNVSLEFWQWLMKREGKYYQEPSIEDRFDVILKFLTTHSLKEDESLWTSFKHLKEARNSLVHTGISSIGKKASMRVDLKKALELSDGAWKIIARIKEWLPSECHWPDYATPSRVQTGKQLIGTKRGLLIPAKNDSKSGEMSEKGGKNEN